MSVFIEMRTFYLKVVDTTLNRLKVDVAQADEEGEETQFLASVDTALPKGEHLRINFTKPTNKEKTFEQAELVCNRI